MDAPVVDLAIAARAGDLRRGWRGSLRALRAGPRTTWRRRIPSTTLFVPCPDRSSGPPENGFRRFWLSLAITMFGTWAGAVALTVRLYDQTHSTTWSSLLYVAEFAPTVFIGIALGRLLDRLPPVRALAIFELTAAASWLGLVDGRPAAARRHAGVRERRLRRRVQDHRDVGHVDAGVSKEHLDAANAATLSIDNLMTLVGYAIGGMLVGVYAPELVLALNAATFLVSALLLMTLPSDPGPARRRCRHEPWRAQVTAGARRMAGRPAAARRAGGAAGRDCGDRDGERAPDPAPARRRRRVGGGDRVRARDARVRPRVRRLGGAVPAAPHVDVPGRDGRDGRRPAADAVHARTSR